MITVLIVNYNTADFIKVSLYALYKLTKNPYLVYILDNNSSEKDFNNLKKISKVFSNVGLERVTSDRKGSAAHGSALNILIKKVKTPYFCILDSDAVWLKKNWDEILINKINNSVKVIGTEAPPGSMVKSNFPTIYAIFFETKTFFDLKIDCRPKNIYTQQDVCYQLADLYHKKNYGSKLISYKNTREFRDGPFHNVICMEYYLYGHSHIFASHFSRGADSTHSKYLKGSSFINALPFIGTFLRKIKFNQEKNKWIETSYQVINEQIS
ncbi:MAG: hypothetical protein ACD_58C00072G0003 [uncultured bacterium]|nr:MAG: hypothetical protein ACD_58C00072G0003 [uncultured bacterium]